MKQKTLQTLDREGNHSKVQNNDWQAQFTMRTSFGKTKRQKMPSQKKKRTLAGLSLRAGGWGISPATKSMTPGYFLENKRKMRPKELPGCSLPYLLTAYTRQFEILETALSSELVICLLLNGRILERIFQCLKTFLITFSSDYVLKLLGENWRWSRSLSWL